MSLVYIFDLQIRYKDTTLFELNGGEYNCVFIDIQNIPEIRICFCWLFV